jgi:small subunit ribosomal protein S18
MWISGDILNCKMRGWILKIKIMKKQNCYFKQNGIKHVDYKDTELLKKFINPHARILSKKRTSVSAEYQRKLSLAIKRARFMALLPYLSR